MRFLVYWSDFPGYAADCVEEFRRRYAERTLVVMDSVNQSVDFDRQHFVYEGELRSLEDPGRTDVDRLVGSFRPDLVLVGGWRGIALRMAKASARRGLPTIGMADNSMGGPVRTRALKMFKNLVLRHFYAGFLVPGVRARRYLLNAGFSEDQIRMGLYGVNTARYRSFAGSWPGRGKSFLFAGRYSPAKGVPELLSAFSTLEVNWELKLCGMGPLKRLVATYAEKDPRIRDLGFLQPQILAEEMARAGAFVLPSRKDPWGVAILEAAASGLPVICSNACGASDDLVIDGTTGYILPAQSQDIIATTLERVSCLASIQREVMGQHGAELAREFDAERWADRLYEWYLELVN